MRKFYWLIIPVLLVLQGCAAQRCDKVQPYQQTVVKAPLQVPADLSEPPLRGQSPDVDPAASTRRPDGGCLERPPPYDPEIKS